MKKYLFILISVLFLSCSAEEDISINGNLGIPDKFHCDNCPIYRGNGAYATITRNYIIIVDPNSDDIIINSSSCDDLVPFHEYSSEFKRYLTCYTSLIKLSKTSYSKMDLTYTREDGVTLRYGILHE